MKTNVKKMYYYRVHNDRGKVGPLYNNILRLGVPTPLVFIFFFKYYVKYEI